MPSSAAAVSAARSSACARRPRQSTSAPPTRSSGAAYSKTTGWEATARATTASLPATPCVHSSALIAREEIGVPVPHLPYARRHVAVDLIAQHLFHHRQDVLGESRPAGHPLVVIAATVAIGPVQPRAREASLQPAE